MIPILIPSYQFLISIVGKRGYIMNHIYKVIWNKAKHCYTVVSEITKNHSQSNKRVRSMTAVVAAAMMLTGFGGMAIEAANPANDDVNIAVGKGASTNTTMGNPVGLVSGYIAIGENAYAWNGGNPDGIGRKESYLDFKQGAVSKSSFFTKAKVTDGTKLAGAIAIGKNTMARTGSVTVGDYTYVGKLGDIEVDPAKKMTLNNGVYSTTLGASSYNSGSMSSVTGAFSIISHKENRYNLYEMQNFGATVYGSLNSIESSKSTSFAAGTANSVLGFGNRTQNTNASLVWGTGNEVTNSIEDVTFSTDWNKTSASDAQKEIIKAMQSDQFAGGSVMAIGGGNKADWATYSQLLGVQNTLTGTEKDVSKLTMINGYKNTVTNAKNTTIIGSNNTATNIQSTIVMGDENTLEGRQGVISLGNKNTIEADDAVAIGNGTTVKAESGVAIGVGSVADRVAESEKGALGAFAPDTIPTGQESTWTSTKGAVSVGDTANNITRQITNVAAGREDTDAVNVAQLKQVASQAERANQGWNLTTNGVDAAATNVAPGGSVDFSGDDNVTVSNQDTKVKVSLNKDINVNSVQTNALNSKYNLSVGTAAADGKMPFFVNSNGAFYAAGSKFVVDKDGSVKATSGDIGNVKLNDGVFYKNSALRDGELYVGDADGNYSQITSKNAKLGKVMIDDTGRISGVAAGRIAADSTDAINGSQLHAVQQEAGKHTKVVNGSNITVEETDQDGQKTYKVGLNKDLLLGDITGKNVSISGTNGTIETTGFIATKDKIYADKGAKLADVNVTGDTISNDKSSVKLDKEGTVTINNRVTIDQSGKISGVAAGEISSTSTDAVNGSQLKATNDRVSQVEGNITEIKGDITNIKSDITNIKGDVKNLGDRVTKVEQEAGKHTKVVNGSNVTVEETDQDGQKTYKVGLNKDLLLGDITGKNVSISGTNGTIETTGSIATKDKIYADKGAKLADIDITGDTISNGQSSVKLDKEGTVTINGKVSVNQDGKVSGVAAGDISEKSTDAVNGSQLFETKQQVAQNVQSISKLGNRINKVGAGAAALAALHPLDFDPDDKWDIAAGYGNYNGENAAAIGAYYRPNEDTMFSVGGSFGNGENMVNAGVSLKLGQGNHVSTSKVAMAKEIKDLRKELEGLKSALLDVNAGKKLDTSKLQLFPDVPKNHWAYEYVSTLKGNGALTGYPDGEFKGDRPMTRYEFATMLYKAMLEGATLSDKILKEFEPELERFTVDTVHQDKDGKPTVERVRTVKAEK